MDCIAVQSRDTVHLLVSSFSPHLPPERVRKEKREMKVRETQKGEERPRRKEKQKGKERKRNMRGERRKCMGA